MASSLRFIITSVFENTGIRQAVVGISTLTAAIPGAIKQLNLLAVAGRVIGFLTFVEVAKAAIGAARAIGQMSPDAARAEVSIKRLSIQLDLLGLSAENNIDSINKFATDTAAATRFAADETRAAVAESVRRTGDVEGSLRRVSIAQDIAAVTGQSLARSLRQVALAEQGRVRSLQLITNLSRQELVSAARRGEVLDVLEEKFEGAAEAEATTLEGLRKRLEAINLDTRRTLGALTVPFKKFSTDVSIALATAGNSAVKAGLDFFSLERQARNLSALLEIPGILSDITQSALRSGDAITALREGLKEAFAPDAGIGAAARATSEQIAEEAEFLALSLGASNDELRQLAVNRARGLEILRNAERDGVKSLSEEQRALLNTFQTFSGRFTELIRTEGEDRVQAILDSEKALENARTRRPTFFSTGNVDTARENKEFIDALKSSGSSDEEILAILATQSEDRRQIFEEAVSATREAGQTQREFANILNAQGIAEQSVLDAAVGKLQTLVENVSAAITPSIDINFNIQPELLANNIREIAEQTVRNFLARVRTSNRTGQRQQDINSSIE